MSSDQEKLIIELVNKGLDGNMDIVNACEDRMIRAKAKAMIIKVKKGILERPAMSETETPIEKVSSSKSFNPDSLKKDELIIYLVNKGLDGDMDIVNACEDKMIRAKAKAMIMKVKKGTVERPAMPELATLKNEKTKDDEQKIEVSKNVNFKVREMIEENFAGSTIDEDDFVCLQPDNWFEIANWLKFEPSLLFDSLQCQTGLDIGDDMLDSRYNLHSMELDHYTEIRIAVPRSNPKVPSVERIWRIADWFERETYDMFGIEYTGHRDLIRILLPDDWEGWPLRKDYEVQETYHGIVVPKLKEGWE